MTRMTIAAAAVLLLLGIGLEVWAAIVLGWRRALDLDDTPPDPALPVLALNGPFRLVRHPQSLGLLLILAGVSVGLHSVRMYLLATLAGAVVIALAWRHDAALAQRFGETYARYRRAVPLLLPRLR
jgi:protein-S-isoprenylcysteine O-methyltransferase Ste14